jgi:hypothetical protein
MRRFRLVGLFLLTLALAIPLGASTRPRPAAVGTLGSTSAGVLARVGRILISLFAPEGSSIDPDGKAHLAPGGTAPLPPGVSTYPTSTTSTPAN